MSPGEPVGETEQRAGAADRHRRGRRPLAGAADGHVRLRPDAVRPLRPRAVAARPRSPSCPLFAGDELDPERSGGDLAVQACADDPQVAFHAVRNLARIGRGAVVMRWSQLGFGRTSSTSRAQETPRNLMGFKDGTNNIKLEDGRALAEHVWVPANAEPPLDARRHVHGHAPHPHADRGLGPGEPRRPGADDRPPQGERRPVRPARTSSTRVNLAADARRRAHPPRRAERERRTAGSSAAATPSPTAWTPSSASSTPGSSSSATRTTRRAFVELQRRLAASDALNEYIKHTGSALFACPPGERGRAATSARRSSGSSQARG